MDLAQAANLHIHWGGLNAGSDEERFDETGGDPNSWVYDVVEILDPTRLRISLPARADGTASYSIGRLSYFRTRVSNCDFFFVVSSVNFMIPHVAGGSWDIPPANTDDACTAFLDERERLIRFWDALGRPVFLLTDDLHNSFAIRITDRIWGFASGPHNSFNHRASDEAKRPANGFFDSQGRPCEIRWSSYFRDELSPRYLRYPFYCVVQINNVFNNPPKADEERRVAFPHPQVLFQYYDGLTGELRYAEAILGK